MGFKFLLEIVGAVIVADPEGRGYGFAKQYW